jgi:hypothetical protein
MDIIVLITSCIIILLIIFCSWNIVYENYSTDVNKHLLLLDSENNLSKYLVSDFTATLSTNLKKLEDEATRLEDLYTARVNAKTINYKSRIEYINNLLSSVFTNGRYAFTLSPGSSKSASRSVTTRTITANHLLLFNTAPLKGKGFSIRSGYLGNGINKFYLTLSANKTEFKVSAPNIRDYTPSPGPGGGFFKMIRRG